MGGQLDHSLINPNQLRHFGTKVQDNPMSDRALSIISEDNEFCMPLSMQGTIVYADTFSPSDQELCDCPHIHLSSSHSWDPHHVKFPKSKWTLDEEIGSLRNISMIKISHNDNTIFSLDQIHRRISSLKKLMPLTNLNRPMDINSGTTDVTSLPTFQSTDRHSDVTALELSEHWGISVATASKTLKTTTQKFLCSAVLPLGRRYRTDRVFTRKTLSGDWSTDTMDGRCKSLDGNKYAQVFANKAYFSRIYPMDSKKKAGDALRLFCQEFGIPERLTFDGSKEQSKPSTKFMKQSYSQY